MSEPSWDQTSPVKEAERQPSAAPQPSSDGAPTWDNTSDPEEKYGGVSGGLKAFGLSAAAVPSFGFSNKFLVDSGMMKPEDIKGYQDQNPISSGAGTVAGVVGSVFAPETGVLGAISAPVRAVSGVGGAIAEGAGTALSPALGKVLGQGAAKFLGSGVEGTAFGLGNSVSEAALGDPDAMGEKLLPSMGTNFLLGGTIGSALGISEHVLPAALEKAGVSTEQVRGLAEKAIAKTAALVSGKPYEDILPMVKGIGTKEGIAMRKQAQEGIVEQEKTVRDLADGLSNQYDSMNKTVKDYYGSTRPEEISTLMEQVPHEKSFTAGADLSGKLKDSIKAMRDEPEIYSATGRIKKLENISDGLEKRISESKTSEDVYHAINDAKGQIQDLTKWGGAPVAAEADTVNSIKSIGRDFRTHLEDSSIYGEAGARQGAINSAYSEHASASKDFVKTFGKKMSSGEVRIDTGKVNTFLKQMGKPGADIKQQILSDYLESSQNLVKQIGESNENSIKNVDTDKMMNLFKKTQGITEGAESELESVNNLKRLKGFGEETGVGGGALGVGAIAHAVGIPIGAAEAAYGVFHTLKNPAELVRVLSGIERAGQKVTGAINKGASAIFKVSDAAIPASSYMGSHFLSAQERMASHDKLQPALSEVGNDPEKMINLLHEKTVGLSRVAPNTAAGLQGSMSRATQFLQSKLPGNNIQTSPLSPKYKPSDSELSKFNKYHSVIENPTSVLKQVASGTVGTEQMEALSAVYPKMLKEMQTAVTDKLTDHMSKDRQIPYRTKMSLSLFLGHDMVNSLNPTSMLANQNMLATATQAKNQQEQMAQNHSVNQKNIGKIGKGNRLLTSAQQSAQRSGEA